MEKFAIITAGGVGQRMDSDIPKQFLEIGGKPILRRVIELFLSLPYKVNIIVVINKEYKELWKSYCFDSNFIFPYILVTGGLTRFHSVLKGLKYLPSDSLVAIHDGVRPFVSSSLITSLYEQAEQNGAAIPVMKINESIRETASDGLYRVADRDRFITVQTPQVFQSNIILKSYKQAFNPLFTDDASVVESAGFPISYIKGERANIKITVPEDLMFAEAILKSRNH